MEISTGGHVMEHDPYPLVNVNKKLWKDPPFFNGKSTISTGTFSIAMLTFTRG